jgi:hypothetical protein
MLIIALRVLPTYFWVAPKFPLSKSAISVSENSICYLIFYVVIDECNIFAIASLMLKCRSAILYMLSKLWHRLAEVVWHLLKQRPLPREYCYYNHAVKNINKTRCFRRSNSAVVRRYSWLFRLYVPTARNCYFHKQFR